MSSALSFGNGRGMARSSTIVDLLVFTTNAPFRGFARFTETVVPLACFETYALMCSARFLNACQDLHASMYTWLGGTVLSSSQGDPDAAGAAYIIYEGVARTHAAAGAAFIIYEGVARTHTHIILYNVVRLIFLK